MVISHSYVSLPEGIHNYIHIAEIHKKFLMNFPFPVVKILVKHPHVFVSKHLQSSSRNGERETYGPCSCILEETQGDMEPGQPGSEFG